MPMPASTTPACFPATLPWSATASCTYKSRHSTPPTINSCTGRALASRSPSATATATASSHWCRTTSGPTADRPRCGSGCPSPAESARTKHPAVRDRTSGRLERSSCRGLDCGQRQSLIAGRRSLSGTQAQSVPEGARGLRSLGVGQVLPRMRSRPETLTTSQAPVSERHLVSASVALGLMVRPSSPTQQVARRPGK